jgi:hypothetical protein
VAEGTGYKGSYWRQVGSQSGRRSPDSKLEQFGLVDTVGSKGWDMLVGCSCFVMDKIIRDGPPLRILSSLYPKAVRLC